MYKYNSIKNRKLFKSLIFIIILFFIMGLIITIFLSKKNNLIIKSSLSAYIKEINSNILNETHIKNTVVNYIVVNIIIFILTMGIIGIPINIMSLAYKSFSLSFTIFNIIKIYKLNGIFLMSYVIPDILNLLVSLIYSYYLIRFNKNVLRKILHKENLDIKRLMKKSIKLFIICIIIFILNAFIKVYIVPSMIKPFIKYLK